MNHWLPMKFDDLLHLRDELLHAARLANLAFAYQWLGNLAGRIVRTGLRGEVVLRGPIPGGEQRLPVLVAKGRSQAVIDEHFLQEEITELYAVLTFVHDANLIEARFKLEDLGDVYLPALRRFLEEADVLPRILPSTVEDTNLGAV